MKIKIDSDGTITHIYDERVDLSGIGTASIKRASHVEAMDYNEWTADMRPSNGGPVLGPFKKRSEALAAEVKWLEENVL